MNQQEEMVVKPEKPKLLGIITNPKETFDRIKENPKVLIPLIVVMILSAISSYFGMMALDLNSLEMEESLPEEGMEMAGAFLGIGAIIAGLIMTPIGILIAALITLAITKIAGTGAKFKQLYSYSTFIFFVSAIGELLNAIIAYFTGVNADMIKFTSLNSLIGAEGGLGGLLSYLEVFMIWATVLSAMGLERVGGLSKKAAWIVTVVFFIIGALFAIVGGSVESMMGV